MILILCGVLLTSTRALPQDKQKAYIRSVKKHRKALVKKFKDPAESPFRERVADFQGFDFFDIDPTYRVTAHFSPTAPSSAKPFQIPTSDPNIKKTYVTYGTLRFTLEGVPCELNVYRSLQLARMPQYKDYLFLPFRDETTGISTYGGGRYLDLRTTDIRGDSLVVDFNLCYNPNCAYTEGWSCPIPPAENFLEVAVKAGEKNYLH